MLRARERGESTAVQLRPSAPPRSGACVAYSVSGTLSSCKQ